MQSMFITRALTNKMAATRELVIHKICPFAHRAWLAAEETKVPYTLKEVSISPGEKPEWFTKVYRSALGADVSSDGKVPVLVDGSFVLTESAVVAEYLIGKYGSKDTVHTITDPEERARATIFVEQQVSKLIKHWYGLLSAQEPEAQDAQRKDLISAIQAISTAYGRTSGPYFLGERFSSADIQVWPWIARLSVNAHYRSLVVPETPDFSAFHAFVAAMKSRPAAAATQKEDAFYIEGYNVYASGSRVPKLWLAHVHSAGGRGHVFQGKGRPAKSRADGPTVFHGSLRRLGNLLFGIKLRNHRKQ